MTARFRLAPIFVVRSAGVAFDVLDRLATPAVSEAARAAAALDREANSQAEAALATLGAIPDRTLRERLRTRLKRRVEAGLEIYDRAVIAARAASVELDAAIDRAYHDLHGELVAAAHRELPDFLVFESQAMAIEVERLAATAAEPRRKDRRKDRTLALYLQRVCAKNDTVSRFGPATWGTVVPGDGVSIRLGAIAERRIEIERWVVKGLVEVVNAEPEIRDELCPRLHPHGRFEGTGFVRLDEEQEIALDADQRAIAAQCDGTTPAYRIGDVATLTRLVELGVIRWELELRARDISFLSTLRDDVTRWRPGPARDRWLATIASVAELGERFGAEPEAGARRAIVAELQSRIESVGVGRRASDRMLYSARNPINENCLLAGEVTIGARAVDAMLVQTAPWIELYRDATALAAMRVYHRIHELVVAAPRRNGRLDYSTLARVAKQRGHSIVDDTLHQQVATEAFTEIKRDFSELLGQRADAPEWQLTAEDCTFLRRGHQLASFDEITYPSADLQISAASIADAAAGRLEWLVAELHHGLIPVQHATYWCCPDKPALHAALAEVVDHRPTLARDAGTHSGVHGSFEPAMWALPRTTYVGVACPKQGWHVRAPSDTEVIVDEERCDIRLHAAGEDLGSLVRTPRLLAGLHPFFPFERAPHAPRLKLGDVIVQRRAWHLDSSALDPQRPGGVSAAFVVAIERARADRGIPRWVFVRPLPGTLATGPQVRDKDNKPIYIDLESVVFLDILERRLRKYGTLLVSEMLPTPQQLFARVPGGKLSFELRTSILPGQRKT